MADKNYRVDAVDCAIDVLQAIAHEQGLSMADIARKVGGSRQRVFRMIKTLEARDLIERGRDGKSYRIGIATLLLGAAARGQYDLVQVADPVMEEIGKLTQETLQLRIRDGSESLCVACWEPDRLVRVHVDVGQRRNFYGGSSKIFLAYMAPEECQRFLIAPLPRYTANSITDIDAMRARLTQIREDGFAISHGEVNAELVSISAPIFGADEKLIAVLNLAAPASRMPPAEAVSTARLVVEAAARISRLMRFSQLNTERKA